MDSSHLQTIISSNTKSIFVKKIKIICLTKITLVSIYNKIVINILSHNATYHILNLLLRYNIFLFLLTVLLFFP